MPIDPNIALGIRTPQAPDPIEQYARVAGIRNLLQQQKDRQAETEFRQQETRKLSNVNAETERAARSAGIVQKSIVDAQGDPIKAMDLARANGADMPEIEAAANHFTAMQQNLAKLDDEKRKQLMAKNGQIVDLAQNALSLNDDQLRATWPEIYGKLAAIEPEAVKKLSPMFPATRDQIAGALATHQTVAQLDQRNEEARKAAEETRKQAEEARKAALAVPQLTKAQNEAVTTAPDATGLTPEQREQATRAATTAAGLAEARGETHRHNVVDEATAQRNAGAGTLSLQEDTTGKPVLFNSKTGQVTPATGVQSKGTAAKQEKETGPARDALGYATTYASSGKFTGPGDEALMEKFFELAKPSTGFRMSQPQIEMLQNARSITGNISGKIRHMTTGTWFSDDQRKEIVSTMKDLAKAKGLSSDEGGIAPIQLKDGRTLTPHDQAAADRFRKEHPELIQ